MPRDHHIEIKILLIVSTVGVSVIDLLTPTGFPIWLFFVIPLLVAAPLRSERAILWTAVLVGTLTIAGAAFSPKGIPVGLALLHRSMGVIVFGSIATFQIFSFRALAARDRSEEQLHIALQHKDVLMRELQHRVKNSLGLVASMLRLEVHSTDDLRVNQVITRSTDRIAAIARVYAMLDKAPGSASVSLDWYLRDVLDSLDRAYLQGRTNVTLSHSLEEIALETRRAVPLGLIVNELVTNAIKHAFPDGAEGSIKVSLRDAQDCLMLTVQDDGPGLAGLADPLITGSTGTGLVRLLAEEIGGRLSVQSSGGVRIELVVPRVESSEAVLGGAHGSSAGR